jgi:NhaP-type Na+/H+ or K+/H+ antiporter
MGTVLAFAPNDAMACVSFKFAAAAAVATGME